VLLNYFIRLYQYKLRKNGIDVDNIVIIGEDKITKIIQEKVNLDNRYGFKIKKNFLIKDFEKNKEDFFEYLVINRIKEVMITNPKIILENIISLKEKFQELNISVFIMPDCYDIFKSVTKKAKVLNYNFLEILNSPLMGIKSIFKRIIDIILSLIFILLFSPIFLLIIIFIKLDSKGNIIFSQNRIGKNEKPFKFYKFRTMNVNAENELEQLKKFNEVDGPIFKMKKDPRITVFGAFLRKFSLDELPQLFNVLKGDMSLIGPRPPIPDEVIEYKEWQKRKFSVTPGITGLWQVRGRSDLSFDEMIKLDIYYIENWTFGLDIYILLKTIPAVLSGRGAY